MNKTRTTKWFVAAALLSVSVVGTMFAQKSELATQSAKQWLVLMDPDKDATVDKAEYVAYMQ
jgi:hypothetical protein